LQWRVGGGKIILIYVAISHLFASTSLQSFDYLLVVPTGEFIRSIAGEFILSLTINKLMKKQKNAGVKATSKNAR